MVPPFLRWTMSARAGEFRHARHRAIDTRTRFTVRVAATRTLTGRSQPRQRHDERHGVPGQGRGNPTNGVPRRVGIVVNTPADAVAGPSLVSIRKNEQRAAGAGARPRALHGVLLAGDHELQRKTAGTA